jgi:hypothetical protein
VEAKPAIPHLFINGVIGEPVSPAMTTEIRQIVENSIHRASHQAPNDFVTIGIVIVLLDTLSKSVDSARLMLELEHICVRVISRHRVFNIDTAIKIVDDRFKTRSTSLESQNNLIVFRESSDFVFHNVDSFFIDDD